MKTAFIIHGAYGSPEENWLPWLKEALEKDDYKVFIPEFPTPENQTLNNWFDIFEPYEKHLNSESIMIGHSLGPAFILRLLEKPSIKVSSCFFISGFISFLGNPDFDIINRTFLQKPFHWSRIKSNCRRFILFHSDNDPYVPIAKAEELKGKLGAELMIIKNGGHFNTAAGYTRFKKLLEKVKILTASYGH